VGYIGWLHSPPNTLWRFTTLTQGIVHGESSSSTSPPLWKKGYGDCPHGRAALMTWIEQKISRLKNAGVPGDDAAKGYA
jgi:hypothetical protein